MKALFRAAILFLAALCFCGCTGGAVGTLAYSDLDDSMLSTCSYITQYDGFYYYANPDDECRLYRMDLDLQNPIKLSDHANAKLGIRVQGAADKLFYLQSERTNNEETPFCYSLFCYDLKSNTESALSERSIIDFLIQDDWIYYETLSPAQSCRMRLDGSENEALEEENSNLFVAQNLYACGDSFVFSCHESITKINYDTNEWKNFPGYSVGLVVYGSYIYSISYNDDYALERYNAKTMEHGDMDRIVDHGVDSFTIIGHLLIYANKKDEIYVTDLNGKGRKKLAAGCAPTASKDYLFYMDTNGKLCSLPLNYDTCLDPSAVPRRVTKKGTQ